MKERRPYVELDPPRTAGRRGEQKGGDTRAGAKEQLSRRTAEGRLRGGGSSGEV